jgi:hypothetical protein
MPDPPKSDSLADDVVPKIVPAPTISRNFVAAPWHRPRKQHIRKYQWNHELVEQIVKMRGKGADSIVRVLGLPSSEYLDLLSMKDVCEEYGITVSYLGFNSSYSGEQPRGDGPIDIYRELQARRMIDTSSFIHPSSSLVADSFERIRNEDSFSRSILNRFEDFDVINLDICGCIVSSDAARANEMLEAISELLRWQSTQRLAPWLFFVTTFASAGEINLAACLPLINAVKANAENSDEFRTQLKTTTAFDVDVLVSWFSTPGAPIPNADQFIRVFALALGKWLTARLKLPTPPSFVSMLPSYCFRHQDMTEPQLLSLAYLIEPAPSAGEGGINPVPPMPPPDHSDLYAKHATKIIKKSFELRDLDQLLTEDSGRAIEAASETEELLIGCGFEPDEVRAFLAPYR